MDFREAKTQKIVMAGLLFVVVAYFWYSRVYIRYDDQIAARAQEFETITTNLRNVEMKAKSLDALQAEYKQLITRYHEIEALLPEVKQIPSLLVQLHTASSLTGTKIVRIEPQPVAPEAFYNIASFEVEMTGTFHDFGAFVAYVANFPFIANIRDMDIKAKNVAITSGQASQQQQNSNRLEIGKKKETLTATFVLSTYYVKDEERLKELSL